MPSSWRTRTHMPKPLAGPEAITSPGRGHGWGTDRGGDVDAVDRRPHRAQIPRLAARDHLHPSATASVLRADGRGSGAVSAGGAGSAGGSAARAGGGRPRCMSSRLDQLRDSSDGWLVVAVDTSGSAMSGRRPPGPSRWRLRGRRGGRLGAHGLLDAELEHVRAVGRDRQCAVRAASPAAARHRRGRRRSRAGRRRRPRGRRRRGRRHPLPLPPRRAAAGAARLGRPWGERCRATTFPSGSTSPAGRPSGVG